MDGKRMTNIEETLADMFADLLDEHFPKDQCKGRGQALVVVGLATMKLKKMFAEINVQNPNNVRHKDSCSFQGCDCQSNLTGIDLGE